MFLHLLVKDGKQQQQLTKNKFRLFVCVSDRWFQMGTNPYTGSQGWLYTGGYFNRNYQDLPDIY